MLENLFAMHLVRDGNCRDPLFGFLDPDRGAKRKLKRSVSSIFSLRHAIMRLEHGSKLQEVDNLRQTLEFLMQVDWLLGIICSPTP